MHLETAGLIREQLNISGNAGLISNLSRFLIYYSF